MLPVLRSRRAMAREARCEGASSLYVICFRNVGPAGGLVFRQTWTLEEEVCREAQRFSVEQIVAVLKQAELGMPVADVIRQIGISEQTFYRLKKQYAGLQSD